MDSVRLLKLTKQAGVIIGMILGLFGSTSTGFVALCIGSIHANPSDYLKPIDLTKNPIENPYSKAPRSNSLLRQLTEGVITHSFGSKGNLTVLYYYTYISTWKIQVNIFS